MIVYTAMAVGALFGGLRARRRRGTGLDIAQYAAVYLILFGVLGMFATIILDRMI